MSTDNTENLTTPSGSEVASSGWLGSLFRRKAPMPPKDPMDWRLTPNSSEWETDQYCPQCKKSTTHRERMSDICNDCGHLGNMRQYRSHRRIWNGKKWVRQFKYGNGVDGYYISEA